MRARPAPSIFRCVSPIRLSAIRLLDLADAGLATGLCAAGLGYWRYYLDGSSGIELAAVAATTLPVAFLRRWPLAVLWAVVAASCAHLVIAPDQVLGPWLGGVLVAFYSVARHHPRRYAAAVWPDRARATVSNSSASPNGLCSCHGSSVSVPGSL